MRLVGGVAVGVGLDADDRAAGDLGLRGRRDLCRASPVSGVSSERCPPQGCDLDGAEGFAAAVVVCVVVAAFVPLAALAIQ